MSGLAAPSPVSDAVAFAAKAERITNTVALDEWLELYHKDAVLEWIADGAHERHEGIEAITVAATAMAAIWKRHGLRVSKTVQCADEQTVVLTWRGGFGAAHRQFGTEIWTLRDGRVARHQMYAYLNVRPSNSVAARLPLLLTAPRIAMSFVRERRRSNSKR